MITNDGSMSEAAVKAAIENEMNVLSDANQLTDADLENVAGATATPTGHCITGEYTTECGTKRTVCGACYTLAGGGGKYCDVADDPTEPVVAG